jgi:hypothetical protein
MTFIVNTGAPDAFYLSPFARKLLEDHGRLFPDNDFVELASGGKARVAEMPNYQPVNIVGLDLAVRWHMRLWTEANGEYAFVFENVPGLL